MAFGEVPRSPSHLGMTVGWFEDRAGILTVRLGATSAFIRAIRDQTLARPASKLARGRGLGLFGSDFALEAGFAPAAGASPPQDNGRGNEDGGVGPDGYPDDDSQGEIAQDRAAEQEQTQNRDQRDRAGKDRPAQRLIDAFVHDLFDRTFAAAGQTFANPIVNNDSIVDGIAGDGEHSPNHGEGKLAVQQRKHTNRDQDVVQQRDNRAHGKGEFEAKGHKNQDAENTETERNKGAARQLTTDESAYPLRAFHFELGLRDRGHDLFFDRVAGVQRRAHGDVIFPALVRFLDRRIRQIDWLQRRPHFSDIDRLR